MIEERDVFSILEDGLPFKSQQKVLRRDRVKKEPKDKKVVVKRVKKADKEEETVVNPETNFVSD